MVGCLTCTFRASCCSARLSRDRWVGGVFNVHIQNKLLERRPVTGQWGGGEGCLTYTFRASCYSARLSRDRGGGGGGVFNVHIQSKLL